MSEHEQEDQTLSFQADREQSPHRHVLYAVDPAFTYFKQAGALPDAEMDFAALQEERPQHKVTDQHGDEHLPPDEQVSRTRIEKGDADQADLQDTVETPAEAPVEESSSKDTPKPPVEHTTEREEQEGTREFDSPSEDETPEVVGAGDPSLPTTAEVVEQEDGEEAVPVSDFTRWLSSLSTPEPHYDTQSVEDSPADAPEEEQPAPESAKEVKGKRKKKKKKKGQKAKGQKKSGKAAPSVVLHEDIFSETLAELLAAQGHVDKAIEMYERMRLIYPEKSRLFAAKIHELKKRE